MFWPTSSMLQVQRPGCLCLTRDALVRVGRRERRIGWVSDSGNCEMAAFHSHPLSHICVEPVSRLVLQATRAFSSGGSRVPSLTLALACRGAPDWRKRPTAAPPATLFTPSLTRPKRLAPSNGARSLPRRLASEAVVLPKGRMGPHPTAALRDVLQLRRPPPPPPRMRKCIRLGPPRKRGKPSSKLRRFKALESLLVTTARHQPQSRPRHPRRSDPNVSTLPRSPHRLGRFHPAFFVPAGCKGFTPWVVSQQPTIPCTQVGRRQVASRRALLSLLGRGSPLTTSQKRSR